MYGFEVEIPTDETYVRCLVLELPRGRLLSSLLQLAYDKEKTIQPLDAIIIRTPTSRPISQAEISRLSSPEAFWPETSLTFLPAMEKKSHTFRRNPKLAVYLLYSDAYELLVSANLNSAAPEMDANQSNILTAVQKAELLYLIGEGRAELPIIPGFYYKAPSGDLLNLFLRAGNIQYSRSALDAIFFWLLPELENCRAILTDTWSIGSTALHVSRRLSSYRLASSDICPVELLEGYVGSNKERYDRADRQIRRLYEISEAQGSGSIVFIMSVVNSGTFYDEVQQLLEKSSEESDVRDATTFIALFRVGAGAASVKSLFSYEISAIKRADPKLIDRSKIIPIDPATLFPSYSLDQKLCIDETQDADGGKPWKEAADFFAYYDANLARVHKHDVSTGRELHHPIWIDTLRLIQQAKFQQKLYVKLLGLNPKPKIVLTPNHEAALLLGQSIIQILNQQGFVAKVVVHSDLALNSEVDADESITKMLADLTQDDAILIADDALITAVRVESYFGNIRKLKIYKGKIHWLFALARPNSDKFLTNRKRLLEYRKGFKETEHKNTFGWIEKVILPGRTAFECPWCAEAIALREEKGDQVEWVRESKHERLEHLSTNLTTGIDSQLFCVSGERDRLFFGPESFFGEPHRSDAEIFAAIASAIQKMRCANSLGPGLGSSRVPISHILEWSDYLRLKWSDSLLRASILRSCSADELVCSSAKDEKLRTEAAEELIYSPEWNKHDLASELIFAAHCGKFPTLQLDDRRLMDRIVELSAKENIEA